MCCLGFVCEQATDREVLYYAYPHELEDDAPYFLVYEKNGEIFDSSLTQSAMEINDNQDTTPQEKEKLLIKLFKDNNIELKFVGKYEAVNNE